MDTLKVEIINSIKEPLVEPANGISPELIAIIAASIGAASAILANLFPVFLSKQKDKTKMINELISKERGISYLITEHYKELVMHKVHKKYWYRTSEIRNSSSSDFKDSHDRHFLSNQRSFETLNKIRVAMSEYYQVVTSFLTLTNENKIISDKLDSIKEFVPRKASDFTEISNYDKLVDAVPIEEDALNTVYKYYSECFDSIYEEMKKSKK